MLLFINLFITEVGALLINSLIVTTVKEKVKLETL